MSDQPIKTLQLTKKSSLITRLRLSFVLLGFLSVFISGGMQLYISWQEHLKQLELRQEAKAQAAATSINAYLDDLQRKISYLARVRGLVDMDANVQQQLLEGLIRHNDAYEYAEIIDANGNTITSISPYGSIVLDPTVRTAAFNRAFRQKEEYIGSVKLDPDRDRPMTVIAVPIRDNQDQVAGILLTQVNLAFLWFFVTRTEVGETGYVYIIDQQRNLVAKTGINAEYFKAQAAIEETLFEKIRTSLRSPDVINRVYRGLYNQRVLGQSHLIATTQWYLVVELPIQEVYQPIRYLAWVGSLILLAITLIAGMIGFLLARSIVQPLGKLTEAAIALSQGNFDTIVQIKARNELGLLANTFNSMTHQVKELLSIAETERESAEVALVNFKKAQAQLMQSEKMSSLGQLVAGVAHEINNPVNFIYGNLVHAEEYTDELLILINLYQTHYPDPHPEVREKMEEMDLDFLSQDLPKMLDSMKVGANRIRDIVLSLRNFSRLDEADLKKANLHEGIENTLMILNNRLKAKADRPAIDVIKDYGDLPLIECYAGQINQVFMNFLANAIDAIEERNQGLTLEAMKAEPHQIMITTKLTDPDTVQIVITDTGKGMDDATLRKLFTPFFTTKPVGKGTGLGLSISYQIVVDKHGGQLDVTSELGQGTTFMVTLPIALAPQPANLRES
ncbi:MAG: sensor histidine kinase [Spirulina sp. DLM2.Bin59]|nr:MAG: sensor histidine kinase [Spirulina sp. DLM2.Bin59]